MPVFVCQVCGRKKYIKPVHLLTGSRAGKYCSPKCSGIAQRNGKMFSCHICGQQTYKSLKDQRRSKSGKFFCNKSCQSVWRNLTYVGENHSNWKGGSYSYRQALQRAKIPLECARCKIQDVRVLTAHHKDQNRKNNSVNNLMWLCQNCHHLVHRYKAESKKFMASVA